MIYLLRHYITTGLLVGTTLLFSVVGLIATFTYVPVSVLYAKGIVAVLGLLLVVFFGRLGPSDTEHSRRSRRTLNILGSILVVPFLFSVYISPRYFGILPSTIRPTDLSVFVFGALASFMLSLELHPGTNNKKAILHHSA